MFSETNELFRLVTQTELATDDGRVYVMQRLDLKIEIIVMSKITLLKTSYFVDLSFTNEYYTESEDTDQVIDAKDVDLRHVSNSM